MEKDELGLYKVNKNILENFWNDLIKLEDWIPFIIVMNLPGHIEDQLGSKVKNKKRWWKRIMEHKVESETSNKGFQEGLNDEVEEFLKKYPNYKMIFKK
ncbi:MAG: heat-shock protein [Methanobacteriaceae archaeon]|nr:heat-shock protein [Methanobacteriaceae archaeon]